eukprot:3622716-Pyramimonas_sp.AAC.1
MGRQTHVRICASMTTRCSQGPLRCSKDRGLGQHVQNGRGRPACMSSARFPSEEFHWIVQRQPSASCCQGWQGRVQS